MSDSKPRFWDLFSGPSKEEPGADEQLERRAERAAQGILENERLTADLDDAAADVLIDWGISCAKRIAHGTAGLDDAEAEEAMSFGLRATGRLMRTVNRWVVNRRESDLADSDRLWRRIVDQAEIIYGRELSPLSDYQRNVLLIQAQIQDPPQIIANLRALIEQL